jgi:hypothetical protein
MKGVLKKLHYFKHYREIPINYESFERLFFKSYYQLQQQRWAAIGFLHRPLHPQ